MKHCVPKCLFHFEKKHHDIKIVTENYLNNMSTLTCPYVAKFVVSYSIVLSLLSCLFNRYLVSHKLLRSSSALESLGNQFFNLSAVAYLVWQLSHHRKNQKPLGEPGTGSLKSHCVNIPDWLVMKPSFELFSRERGG